MGTLMTLCEPPTAKGGLKGPHWREGWRGGRPTDSLASRVR